MRPVSITTGFVGIQVGECWDLLLGSVGSVRVQCFALAGALHGLGASVAVGRYAFRFFEKHVVIKVFE